MGFYAGFFSWFVPASTAPQERDINFVATVFGKVFTGPKPGMLDTLAEKACLNYFVDEVLIRLFSALKMKSTDIEVFCGAWDPHQLI